MRMKAIRDIVSYAFAFLLKTSMAIMKEITNHRIIDTIGDHIGMPDGVEPVSIPMFRLKEPPIKPPGLKSIK